MFGWCVLSCWCLCSRLLNSENRAARQPQFFPVPVHHSLIRHSLLTGVCVCVCVCVCGPQSKVALPSTLRVPGGWQPGLAQCQPLQWQLPDRSSWVITARCATSHAQAFESLEFHQFGDRTFGPGQAEHCSSRLQTYPHAFAQKSADIHNLHDASDWYLPHSL